MQKSERKLIEICGDRRISVLKSRWVITRGRIGSVVVAVIVVMAFGASMLTGVLPLYPGISWQGHLFGALGGGLAAVWLGRADNRRAARREALRARTADPYGLRELGL